MTQSKQEIAIQVSIKNRVAKLTPTEVEKELTGLRKIIKANKSSLAEDRLTEQEKQTFLALKAKKGGNVPARHGKFEGRNFVVDNKGIVQDKTVSEAQKDFEDFDKAHGWKLGTSKTNTQNSMKDRFEILTNSAQTKVKKFLKGRSYNDLNDEETKTLSHLQAGLPTDDMKWLARHRDRKKLEKV